MVNTNVLIYNIIVALKLYNVPVFMCDTGAHIHNCLQTGNPPLGSGSHPLLASVFSYEGRLFRNRHHVRDEWRQPGLDMSGSIRLANSVTPYSEGKKPAKLNGRTYCLLFNLNDIYTEKVSFK